MLEVYSWLQLILRLAVLALYSKQLKNVAVLRLNEVLFKVKPVLLHYLLEASANVWVSIDVVIDGVLEIPSY